VAGNLLKRRKPNTSLRHPVNYLQLAQSISPILVYNRGSYPRFQTDNFMLTSWRQILKRITLVTACLFLLNGCTTKLAYNFLDWGILWYLETYVDLNKEQKNYAKKQLAEFHHWHRTTQLTRYALYLEGLQMRLIARNMTGEMMHGEIDELQVYLDECIVKLTPMFVQLASTLSDEQVKELMNSLQKERDQYQKEYVDISEKKLHKTRTTDLRDHLNIAISGFNAAQKTKMLEWSQSLQPFEELTLKQQQIWADELQVALNQRQQRQQLDKTIRKLLFVHTDHWNEELEKRMGYNQALTYTMLANLLNELTSEQSKNMNKKLTGYISDFRELAIAKEKTNRNALCSLNR
jgi:hypothetical protein